MYLYRTLFVHTIVSSVVVIGALFTHISLSHAHEGHVHSSEATATEVSRQAELVSLMQRLVYLLTALRDVQNSQNVAPNEMSTEMELHHDEHTTVDTVPTENESESAPKLVIEVETHFDQTHVHVRYVDKPEEMFFIPVSINDEEGIVDEVLGRTGLTETDIRAALTYFR